MKLLKYNIFSSKNIVITSVFFTGLLVGYFLGLLEIHRILYQPLSQISIDLSWFNWFLEFSPDTSFLSDIAAFEAVIIAFLVPLSIEIVSKLSERYQSDVITRTFENSWENIFLPRFLLINIVLAVVLRFITEDNINPLIWKVLLWLLLLSFILIAWVILRVINRIKKFMRDTQFVVDELYQDIEDSLE